MKDQIIYYPFSITDNFIIKEFINTKNIINARKLQLNFLNRRPQIKEYLDSRFTDSSGYHETIIRIFKKIYIRPVCPICGGRLSFGYDQRSGLYFARHCSRRCKQLDENVRRKQRNTKLTRYGNENFVNIEKTAKTKEQKYGSKTYNNVEKNKQTKKERYGNENYNNREKFLKIHIKLKMKIFLILFKKI